MLRTGSNLQEQVLRGYGQLKRTGVLVACVKLGTLKAQRTDVIMATVARAEPSSVITALADGDATQVSADAKHDEPFGLLGAGLVRLGVAERLDVDAVGLLDLLRGTVADEDGLAAPFDDDVLA